MSLFLNTRLWLLISGSLFTLFPTFGALSGNTVATAPDYWPGTLTSSERDIAAVVEIAWNFQILAIGLIVIAIALLTEEPARARLGVVAMLAFGLGQGLSVGSAAQFGYGGSDVGPLFLTVILVGIPLITLVVCVAARWTQKPSS
jgi:uncharacterized protein (DUF983 family)